MPNNRFDKTYSQLATKGRQPGSGTLPGTGGPWRGS
jgi:hypothetical protein